MPKATHAFNLTLHKITLLKVLRKKTREISQLKEQTEKLKALIDFANAFKDPVSLQFFLDTFRKAEGIRLPPN